MGQGTQDIGRDTAHSTRDGTWDTGRDMGHRTGHGTQDRTRGTGQARIVSLTNVGFVAWGQEPHMSRTLTKRAFAYEERRQRGYPTKT